MSVIKTAGLTACIAASLLLISCSSQKLLQQSSSRHSYDPHFLEDIALEGGGHSKIKTVTNTPNTRRRSSNSYSNDKPLQAKYADILGVRPQLLSNAPLYDFIDDWYGVHYRLGGNDKSGIDCSGFVKRLYEQVFGTNLLRTAMEQFNNCKMVWDTDKVSEGDLVFFSTHGKRITHVGVYLANRYFVHASTTKGVIISSLNEEYWTHHYAGAGHIPRG